MGPGEQKKPRDMAMSSWGGGRYCFMGFIGMGVAEVQRWLWQQNEALGPET